ncbi:hypothetical protein [Salinibacter ruber]|uniref:hypothetical protein n=1 Tax=Salinibacter ruber TaxID=146919 RepID=UPI0020732BCA|nr:hypothetical protein [Salinibacter ruber]
MSAGLRNLSSCAETRRIGAGGWAESLRAHALKADSPADTRPPLGALIEAPEGHAYLEPFSLEPFSPESSRPGAFQLWVFQLWVFQTWVFLA